TGKEARLQLSYPVPACRDERPVMTCQPSLNPTFIKPLVIESSENRCDAAEAADERKLHRHDVAHKTEASALRKRQTLFRAALHLGKRIAGDEKVCNQVVP